MTITELLQQHPEYADLDIVVYTEDGSYEWVGGSACVYADHDEEEDTQVLVFAAN